MKEVVFEVKGKVKGKARPRVTHNGHAYTPVSTRLYEKAIRDAFVAAGGQMFHGYVHVDFEAVTGIQASATKAQRKIRLQVEELSTTKPDIDNIEKSILDALNGVAYEDDSSVVSVRAIKGRYEQEPRLLVRVREAFVEDIRNIHAWLWDDEA